jgi:hypothetical protein
LEAARNGIFSSFARDIDKILNFIEIENTDFDSDDISLEVVSRAIETLRDNNIKKNTEKSHRDEIDDLLDRFRQPS